MNTVRHRFGREEWKIGYWHIITDTAGVNLQRGKPQAHAWGINPGALVAGLTILIGRNNFE